MASRYNTTPNSWAADSLRAELDSLKRMRLMSESGAAMAAVGPSRSAGSVVTSPVLHSAVDPKYFR
jgi:hypothetical protein